MCHWTDFSFGDNIFNVRLSHSLNSLSFEHLAMGRRATCDARVANFLNIVYSNKPFIYTCNGHSYVCFAVVYTRLTEYMSMGCVWYASLSLSLFRKFFIRINFLMSTQHFRFASATFESIRRTKENIGPQASTNVIDLSHHPTIALVVGVCVCVFHTRHIRIVIYINKYQTKKCNRKYECWVGGSFVLFIIHIQWLCVMVFVFVSVDCGVWNSHS